MKILECFEKSFQKKIFVLWDSTITLKQQEIIKVNINELFEFLSFDKSKLKYLGNYQLKHEKFNLNLSFDENLEKCRDKDKNKVNVDIAISSLHDFGLGENNWSLSFTNKDIFNIKNDYLFGGAFENYGALISFYRYGRYIKDSLLKEALKSLIFHETGHVLGLVTNRRGVDNLEINHNGIHCKNVQCSMKYGEAPKEMEDYAKIRLNHDSPPYCHECLTDLNVLIQK